MNIDRDMLKSMAVVAGAAILAGCSSSKNNDDAGSTAAQFAMLVDLDRCIGCAACVLACKVENGTQHGVYWCNLKYQEVENAVSAYCDIPQVRRFHKPSACHHCRDAECIKVCPVGASRYDPNDGTVIVDKEVCLGCAKCVDACPYEARQFNYVDPLKNPAYGMYDPLMEPKLLLTPFEIAKAGKHPNHRAEKCVFCADRRAKGEQPACVETCVAKARFFGRLDDPGFQAKIAELGAIPDLPDENPKNLDPQPSYYIAGHLAKDAAGKFKPFEAFRSLRDVKTLTKA